ncbi:2TM domain-containing protein [Paenibacillus amylolyticus]|uniref:2TM domain-containing protein n=1 Tax=Paenibacillus amylolyticus TaxID=1451 RepID=A0A5M9WW29_PAEAM|nr:MULTISPECIES: 2TM domain-containing protein [Paenibacillus]KAA8785742.1 2TM domain-containing protein [Paenibacillus amylolyticus]
MTLEKNNEEYEQALKRVKALKDFYIHLVVYILVNTGLIIYNLVFYPDSIWFIYTLLGWGIGVIAHGFTVWGGGSIFGAEWEKKKIEKYMNKK